MRILLVDNYDSFTHNLAHYLALITGQEPVVVPNDSPLLHPGLLSGFDAVVLSPGPGTPARTKNVGRCRELVESCGLPLLGICLGHQGIAQWHGASVSRAPEPRHGRLSPVLHDGTGLFTGLPSPFNVVRYHSLAVDDLPRSLQATAWSADGVLMGLEHRSKPMWGVQFHPESILTEHGMELLRNFVELSRAWHRDRPGLDRPALAAPVPWTPTAAALPRRSLQVRVERLDTGWDDEVAFEALFGHAEHAFWLDSSAHAVSDTALGRFSVMGDAGGPLSRVAEADVRTQTVTVRSSKGTEVVTGEWLSWLDRDLAAARIPPLDLPFDFCLGWVGYLGYELKAECGGRLAHQAPEPDAAMIFADHAVVFDHHSRVTYLLALVEDGQNGEAVRWLRDTRTALEKLRGRSPRLISHPVHRAEVTLRHDRAAYLGLVDRALEEIAAGESYEVCLTNMAEARGAFAPLPSYRLLRRSSPAPFGALLRLGSTSVLSTSPERFVKVGADGRTESKPIKGTRPRGRTAREDAELVADLLSDEKDRAENLMIVDLVRNDLGRCAEPGSVQADEIFQVETYESVHQLVSTVRAQLRKDASAVDCVRSAFPPGSMTGAPKIRTMEIIDELEGGPRGVYSGALGYFSLSGAADLSVVIRTVVITPGRVRYGVGGAVIALSSPEDEFEETAVKAAPLLSLTRTRFPGSRGSALPAPGPTP
ncbi:aminodeoxychorismate synthase component I [Streptomyces sp. NPDC004250]|uniref:aminodeoxychorismate synthase component I n=1 Tax=Streptomyces sp. NPDC004250 TaxID=3364692 RepID=UPI003680EA28